MIAGSSGYARGRVFFPLPLLFPSFFLDTKAVLPLSGVLVKLARLD